MNCKLCNQEIKNYNLMLNNLKIDKNQSVDICLVCIDKLIKWQGSIYAKLFPTNTAKKFYEKNK